MSKFYSLHPDSYYHNLFSSSYMFLWSINQNHMSRHSEEFFCLSTTTLEAAPQYWVPISHVIHLKSLLIDVENQYLSSEF
jgi:hypothetical protein